jgi:hypothetical protein
MRPFLHSKRTSQRGAIQHLVFLVIGLFAAIYFQAQPKVHVGHDEPGTFESVPPNMLMMPAPPPVSLDYEDGLSWPALKAAFVTLSMQSVLEVNARNLEGGVFAGVAGDGNQGMRPDQASRSDTDSLYPLESPAESIAHPTEDGQQIGDNFQHSERTRPVGLAKGTPRTPVKIPIFDMDPYLEPGSGRIIYFNKSKMKDVSHDETAVFVMQRGENLVLDGCHFPGGVIVQVAKGTTPTGGYLNKVRLKGGTKIGGGADGASVNIGLLAPEFELQYTYAGIEYASQTDIEGFSAVAKMGTAHQVQLKGMVLVFDAEKQVWNTHIENNPDVAQNLPEGVEYRMVLR